jgi:glutaredoxin
MRDIETLGISDQIEFRDTRQDPHWRTDLRSQTGRTQVPCLFIDGEPMFESADISAWLKTNCS